MKKKWASYLKYFWSDWLREMCLFKCITGLVSEKPIAVNVLTSPKNSCNMQKTTFILVIRPFEPNWVRKGYFSSDLRFSDCLITRWLPTTSSLVLIERIYSYQIKPNYLKSPQLFAASFFEFLESALNFQCFEKKMSLIAQVFLKLLTPGDVLV